MPSIPEEWQKVGKEWGKWNFPNCIRAVDWKHVILQAPINSGKQYYNYNQYFSIVLLVLVDADYQ